MSETNNNNYVIKGETLSNIADGIRRITGTTDELIPSQMAEVMSTIEPGSGSDNGKIDTCTIQHNITDLEAGDIFITVFENNEIKTIQDSLYKKPIINNVVCNSIFAHVPMRNEYAFGYTCENGVILLNESTQNHGEPGIFQAPSVPNTIGTFDIIT